MTSCATAAPSGAKYAGVPLPPWSKADQKAAAARIKSVCGDPPLCPVIGAVLERAALDYVKLRNEVRAAGGQ